MALGWLRRLARLVWPPMSNLLHEDVLCEIVIHVMPDFTRKVYVSKFMASPQTMARVVESIVRTGVDVGAQHGIQVQFAPPTVAPGGPDAQAQPHP